MKQSIAELMNSINSFDDLKNVENVISSLSIHPDQRNRWLREATRRFVENCPFS